MKPIPKLCECGHGKMSHKHHAGVGYVGLCIVRNCYCHSWCEMRPPIMPYDSQPVIRKHSITGWWQVWSGGFCLTLLRPDDVKPIVEAWLAQLPPEHHDTASHTRCARCGDPAGDPIKDGEK